MKVVAVLVRSPLTLVLAAICVVALTAGCAKEKTAFQVPPGKVEVAVEASSFAFNPNVIQARAGQALLLKVTNVAGMAHNMTVLDPQGKELANIGLPAGRTTEIQLPPLTAGTYQFHCDKPLHPSLGMKGEIRVGAP